MQGEMPGEEVTFGGRRLVSQPAGAATVIFFKISRSGFNSRSPAGTLLNFKM